MGHVQTLANGRRQARFRGPDGKEHTKVFDRERDARAHIAAQEVSKVRGEWVDPRRARIKVDHWASEWLATKVKLKPSTRATYGSLIERHILPHWGRWPLASIGHADVTRWVAGLTGAGLSASRTRQEFRVFSMMLGFAVRDGRLSRNPADGVELPRVPESNKRFLTHEQLVALAEASGRCRTLVLVLGYCGLRWGEAASLRVRSLDLLRGRINVSEGVVEIDGRLVYGTPKGHHQRWVPVPRFLRAELAALCEGKRADELVFTSPEGAALRERNFRRRYFDRACVEAGLPGLTPHELRHTAASLAVGAGANVKHVQRMLGHKSAAMTLDVYAGLFEEGLDTVAERLDAAAYQAFAESTRNTATHNALPITVTRTRRAR